MIYKYFHEPRFHDAAFYQEREVADHIHQPAHRVRLMRTLADIFYICAIDPQARSLADFGCGNGGLLMELADCLPAVKCWGYDLSPSAVAFARERYQVDASLGDFTTAEIEVGEIAVLTETLEHLVDPVAMLRRLKEKEVRWVVASVPTDDDHARHYEFHLWAWTGHSFEKPLREAGFVPVLHYSNGLVTAQHLVAYNPARVGPQDLLR